MVNINRVLCPVERPSAAAAGYRYAGKRTGERRADPTRLWLDDASRDSRGRLPRPDNPRLMRRTADIGFGTVTTKLGGSVMNGFRRRFRITILESAGLR